MFIRRVFSSSAEPSSLFPAPFCFYFFRSYPRPRRLTSSSRPNSSSRTRLPRSNLHDPRPPNYHHPAPIRSLHRHLLARYLPHSISPPRSRTRLPPISTCRRTRNPRPNQVHLRNSGRRSGEGEVDSSSRTRHLEDEGSRSGRSARWVESSG